MADSLDVADSIFVELTVLLRKKLFHCFFVLVMCSPLTACGVDYPDTYSAESIYGQVIDKETRKPIVDVVVVAFWMLEGGSHFDTTRPLHFMETTTDEFGDFRLPAWGPKRRPKGEILTNLDPEIWLFKPGYYPGGLSNPIYADPSEMAISPVRTWAKNGDAVELKRFDGDLTTYKRIVSSRDYNLRFRMESVEEKCGWKKIPKAIVRYRIENLKLIRGNSDAKESLLQHLATSYEEAGCDAHKFFKERLK